MATFQGKPVFRPRGRLIDHPGQDWEAVARKAISGGGRILQSRSGDFHVVSPSDAHWGTYKSSQGAYEGGSLQKLQDDTELKDVTDKFQ